MPPERSNQVNALPPSERLPGWELDKPELENLANILACETEEIRPMLFEMWADRHIDLARGHELDAAGDLLELPRLDRCDHEYRCGLWRRSRFLLTRGHEHTEPRRLEHAA